MRLLVGVGSRHETVKAGGVTQVLRILPTSTCYVYWGIFYGQKEGDAMDGIASQNFSGELGHGTLLNPDR